MSREEKKLIKATLVLILLLGIGSYFKSGLLKKQEAQEALLWIDVPTNVQKIMVQNTHGKQTLLSRVHGKDVPSQASYRDQEFIITHNWYVGGQPLAYVAPARMDTLFSSIDNTQLTKEITTDQSRLAEYGLQDPSFILTLQGQDQTTTLSFGDQDIEQSHRYVFDGKTVYLADANLDFLQSIQPQEWVEKNIITLSQNKLSKLVFDERTQRVELSKQDDTWQILVPEPVQASSKDISSWIRTVNSSQAQALTALGDDEGVIRTSITLEKYAKDQKNLTLSLRQIGEHLYVDRSDDDWLYEINADQANIIFEDPYSFVDLGLEELESADMERITLTYQGNEYELNKSSEWMASKPFTDTVSQEHIDGLISLLNNIVVVEKSDSQIFDEDFVFSFEKNQKKHVYAFDEDRMLVRHPSSDLILKVTLPDDFGQNIKAQLVLLRKRDLYPQTMNEVTRIGINNGTKTVELTRSDDGTFVTEHDLSQDSVDDIVNLINEVKIKRFDTRKGFVREGTVEIHVQTKDGLAYTWHVGQIKDGEQLILALPKFSAGWVDAAKLEELLKKI